ncbi:MAG: 8-oxoguanine deaminase [Candidatus Eremiobacteraeota bacterium]|nr:8-oxoguanine deaminase [Candidatus Eremiobacteraeota bacterium]
MSTTLIRNAAFIGTFDDAQTRYQDGSIFIRGNVIEKIGTAADVPQTADTIIDASKLILIPGLINTHHHFYQTLTRNVPGPQDAGLFEWLKTLYPLWARMNPEAIRISTQIAMAELMLTGCTTAFDHGYVWPHGARVDDQIEGAKAMGMRFHASRGSMSLGQSKGGLPPDSVVEDEAAILKDSQRVIESYHDPQRYAMLRIVLAPCSPFSVSGDLMRESIKLARAHQVHSHTHLAETFDEEAFCVAQFGKRPADYASSLGWTGTDVWHAHAVHLSEQDVAMFGATRTGTAHCPSSNMRLGSGISPVPALRKAGARVGLGVDGSASNDSSAMLEEARQALLIQRVGGNPSAVTARDVLWIGTRGGAQVLGRDDIGMLAPGMAADIVGYRTDALGLAGGAVHDPLASLIFCRPGNVDFNMIDGRVRISGGNFVDVNLPKLIERHNQIARAMVRDELH